MKSFQHFFLTERSLAGEDIEKHSGKYLRELIRKIKAGESISFKDGSSGVVNKQTDEIKSFLGGDKDVLKAARGYAKIFQDTKTGKAYAWTEIEKTSVKDALPGKSYNKGDVIEGILAAAVTAKFLKPDTIISPKAIQGTLKEIERAGGNKLSKDRATSSMAKDQITCLISLKPESAAALFNSDVWPDLGAEFKAAASYANSKYVERYAQLLDRNNTNDNAIVDSQGAANEKGTKVDMAVMIGLDGKTPRVTKLNLSIKSGHTQNLEQAGTNYDKILDLFNKIGVDVSQFEDSFEKVESWYSEVFRFAEAEINKRLFRGDKAEYEMIKAIGRGVVEFGTRSDSSVVKVLLNRGDFKISTFRNVERKLAEIKLEAFYDDSKKRPYFGIRDQITKKSLINFRVEVRNQTQIYKIHIEKGPLLDEITHIKN